MKTLNEVQEFLEYIEVPEATIEDILYTLKDKHENGPSNKLTDETIGDYRIINSLNIDEIQKDELEGDAYLLGSFRAGFLAPIIGCPIRVVKLLQEHEEFETIGEWIIGQQKIWEIQEEYSYLDGYGHHFAHYDGVTEEFTFDGEDYYIFRVW